MSMKDCASEPKLTIEFLEGTIKKGRGVTPSVTRSLIGHIVRGDQPESALIEKTQVIRVSLPTAETEEDSEGD